MTITRRWWGAWGALAIAATFAGCKQPDAGGSGGAGMTSTTGAGGTTPTGTTGGTPALNTAAGVKPAPPYAGSDILIGEYGSLTGTTADFGTSSRDGIKMAVDEINKSGGILGKQVRVQLEDDASSPQQAATVVKKLINQDNVLAVLGEVASSRSLAAAPICQAAGVPMISPTSTNPKVTQVGDYIFRTCFIDPFQGTAGARFAAQTLKAKNAAVLTDVKNDYSVGLSKFFTDEFTKSGKIVATENYKEGDKDFRAQLANIKAANPDVIFIPGYYTEVGAIAKQARGLGIKQPLLGGDGWDSPDLASIGGDAVNGAYFSTHASPESKDPRTIKFVAGFKQRFGHMPNALSQVAYDAATLLCAAIKRAGSLDRAKIRDAIAATKNFPGVTGNITIDANRNAVKQLVMLQVRGDHYAYFSTVKP